MIDLHSHALHGIDDGAETIDDALRILKGAERAGTEKMVLTPHFTIGEDVKEFVKKRDAKAEELRNALKDAGIRTEILTGAEIYITDEIYNETDLDLLTMGESNVLLCEFKYHSLREEVFADYVEQIMQSGHKVLIAHPERYSYLRNNGRLLDYVLNSGAMLQINGISLFEENEAGDAARMLLKAGAVFAIGGDIHHAPSRRIDAMRTLNEQGRWERLLCDNPEKLLTQMKG